MTNLLPGYVNTNLSHAAIGGKGGALFGKEDPHLLHGMKPEKFAQQACDAIYYKDNEVVITNKLLHHIAIFMRTVWPDAVFSFLSKQYKKSMKKFIDYDKKSQ